MFGGLGTGVDASSIKGLKGFREAERLKRLERARRSLWWLATEILGFDLLTREFHKPMMDDMDRQRADYHTRVQHKRAVRHYHEMWPRDHYKTTVRIAQCVQDYLFDPTWTNSWWHAVEDMAVEAGVAIGKFFMENDELRALWPEIMPSKRARKWVTNSGFRFKANKDKAPSLRMWGAGSEATGGHSIGGYLDDPIGYNDIEDSLMPKKRRWMGRTVRNVIRSDIGWLRGTGTHWDSDDIYMDWKKSKVWYVRVRGCYETDNKPDWNGEPVLFTREQIEAKREEMSAFEFSCQMMNDPLPDEARMWHQDACEHYCTLKQAAGPGRVFVLSDPAPAAVGSISGVGEKARADGSKDWWSMCVVKIRAVGQRQEIILLDGIHSQDWRTKQGMAEACRLMGKWGTNLFFNESYGGLGADYTDHMLEQAKVSRVSLYLDRKGRLPRFADSHASGAKNLRFEALADKARAGEFLICESCPESFLHGDNDKVGFLPQARKWMALARGRNSLKWDDDADVVSRATDSALQDFAPQIDVSKTVFFDLEDEQHGEPMRSLYCGI